jgi:hypothetical protein
VLQAVLAPAAPLQRLVPAAEVRVVRQAVAAAPVLRLAARAVVPPAWR